MRFDRSITTTDRQKTRPDPITTLRHRKIELIIWPLEEESPQLSQATDAQGWPVGFIEKTYGSIPDFPDREPQGEYEQRLEIERRFCTASGELTGGQYQALLDLLDRPVEDNAGLRELFSRPAPWDAR